ncbi:hypothetical protein SDC9_85990 [bioreactor metagenome]|uniref:Uncharacterized protein n=1 Tax=bioreactor metagenome TaxID=1076179 RepID=A0A644ZF69_9ZZZZ
MVEDVHIFKSHPLQALVTTGNEILAAPPLTIRARPHVVAGFGGNDELITIGSELVGEHLAEASLCTATRRSIVVCKVEVGDAMSKAVVITSLHT